jgi:hypothetical protein
MRLLCFQVKRFWWKVFSRTLAETEAAQVAAGEEEREVREAVVAFVHVEGRDAEAERAASVERQTLKHLKWLANKRGMRVVVLHSFTHLGGESAPPDQARAMLTRLVERLGAAGYETHVTPFGYFNEWSLDVHGESLAKVWKEI